MFSFNVLPGNVVDVGSEVPIVDQADVEALMAAIDAPPGGDIDTKDSRYNAMLDLTGNGIIDKEKAGLDDLDVIEARQEAGQ